MVVWNFLRLSDLWAYLDVSGKHVVFGKVIRGYDVVKRMSEVPVDVKDRPKVPVAIYNCGELELRKKQGDTPQGKQTSSNPWYLHCALTRFSIVGAKKRSKRLSDDEDGSDVNRRRRKHRSDSSEEIRSKRRKKSKHKKDRAPTLDHDDDAESKGDRDPVAETEEEYDARLEREENERREAERKNELERIRKQYADDAQSADGVRFKGWSCFDFFALHFNYCDFRSREDEVCRPGSSPATSTLTA
jgi:peptidyl-prolyl isomerase G (cyclophilin G)